MNKDFLILKIVREKSRYLTTLANEGSASKFLSENAVTGLVMCGRSNVGKSTLINALLKNGIAHTSGTPGKTQNINVYEFYKDDDEKPFFLFDLPGFGHAKVSKTERQRWDQFLNEFFRILPASISVVHIMDARQPFQKADMQFVEFFQNFSTPSLYVFNKIDKLKNQKERSQLDKKLKPIQEKLFKISADKKQNIEALEQYLLEFLNQNRHQ